MNTKLQELGEVLVKEPRAPLRLYEIADALESIEDTLLENGGELTPELEAALEALEGTLEQKAERICRVIRNHDASAKAFDAEIERLRGHKKAHENTVARLKDYLKTVLVRLDRTKVDAGVFKVALQNNSRPAIRWTLDPAAIPEQLRRVPPAEVDGDAAYEAWKKDRQLPPGFEVELGSHIRIR